MRLGIDLDGTVADLHGALVQEARRLFPGIDPAILPSSAAGVPTPGPGTTAGPSEDHGNSSGEAPTSIGALSSRQQRDIWDAVCARENFWESLDELEPGALARLYRLVQERQWELIFLTSRPETRGDTAQDRKSVV